MKSEYKKALLVIFFAVEFLSVKYRHGLYKRAVDFGDDIFVALLMPICVLAAILFFVRIYQTIKDDIKELIKWFDTDD